MNVTLLKQMLAISQEMAVTRNIENLLTLATEKTTELTGAEFCYLILLDQDGNLDFRARSSSNQSEEVTDALSRSVFDEVVTTAKPILLTDALSSDRFALKSSVLSLRIRSVMCVPLIAGGRTLGALYVENRRLTGAFRQEDLEPLIFFANHAAAAIENAMIIADLENRVTARTAELETSWHDAVESNKMRTTLLGQIAHDLRTPLTVITLSLFNLNTPRYGPLNEMQKRWVRRALNSSQHMNELVSNIFDLSKVELNTLEINKEPTPLKPFLERIHEIGLALPRKENVNFESNIPSSLPELNIDPVRIQQVLMNLISNAFKFTDSGSVIVHAEVGNQDVHIGVRDTGEGVPLEAQSKIFDRFSQFDGNNARRTSGSGLGLAICRELVEKHDGQIWIKSELGTGSDFIFTLPL